jgi:hypothetical protein
MKPRVFIKDYNGINQSLKKRTDELDFVDDPRDAEAIVTWQDVRGEMLELAKINKEHLHKPFIVVQHGRGCTRDYEAPDNFPLLADKFCCWGQDDYDRLVKLGYKDRAVITGSPLINRIKPKVEHPDKNIIFAPVTTMHEEPDNLITFWEMKKIELSRSQEVLRKHRKELINDWNPKIIGSDANTEHTIPYLEINKNWRLISKLTPVHDKSLYLGAVTQTSPTNVAHIEQSVELLTQTDVVVCLEEGTFQVLVMAMDIPIIVVKGFTLTNYGGQDYSNREVVKTSGARWVDLADLEQAIDEELAHPESLAEERKKVVAREFGDISKNPDDNIIKVIKELING